MIGAQIVAVRFAQPVGGADTERTRIRLEGAFILGGGLLTAATLLLGYTGHRDAAVALGVTGALLGAVIGVVRLASS